jgi:hypothetical protein
MSDVENSPLAQDQKPGRPGGEARGRRRLGRQAVDARPAVLIPCSRRFPPPWSIDEYNDACSIVRDHNGQALKYVGARPAVGGQAAHEGRGSKDRGEYPEAAASLSRINYFLTLIRPEARR